MIVNGSPAGACDAAGPPADPHPSLGLPGPGNMRPPGPVGSGPSGGLGQSSGEQDSCLSRGQGGLWLSIMITRIIRVNLGEIEVASTC